MLKITFYDGEYDGDLTALAPICEIDGSVVPEDRPPYAPLEETRRLLEMCADKYSVPRPAGQCFTVLIGRKAGTKVVSLARLDVHACNGRASANVRCKGAPDCHTGPVCYEPEDDAAAIVLKVLVKVLHDESRLSTLAQSRLDSVNRAIKVKLDDL
ncbi:hypothetical protein [Paraburkholderia phenazinium]|uniref:hypothetical protein n=1 Tax=Paraburkholderia phenazinium TaxID=60549 RepID=UPI0015889185|nr:hypothetical protein [Paraburkholderia phenazinium]